MKIIDNILTFLIFCTVACTGDFEDLNTPPDRLVAENLNIGQVGQAFASTQFRTMNLANYEVSQNLFSDLFSQYMALIQETFHSDRYVNVSSWANSHFNSMYTTVAKDLIFIENLTQENGFLAENALIKIWRVQAFHRLTDYYGPIPYFEVGLGGTSVAYDSQESIYKDFFQTLDEAVAVLEQHRGQSVLSRDDLVYGGSVDKWLIFANSLRLRLALRVKYVAPELSRQEAEKAISGGVMMTEQDNAMVATNESSLHSLGRISNFNNWRMSASMESILVGFDDPRLDAYWNPVVEDTRNDGREFHGVRNGLPLGEMNKAQFTPQFSKIDNHWWRIEDGGDNPPYQVMRAEEVYFLRAEGALEGWDMGGTAKELYEKGIEISISSRTNTSPETIASYINSSNRPVPLNDKWNTPAVSDIPVAFEVTGDKERQLEQIGTQKWIALFPDGWEAWAEMRRLGYPKYLPRLQSDNPDVAANEMIRRLTYVDGEYSNNAQAVNEALKLPELADKGGDRNSTRLWWDAK